jgi:hypothetical protein
MSKALNTRMALGNISDLTTPTATQQYPLGFVATIDDSDVKMVKKYIYVKAHGALTQYQPYVLNFTGTSGAEVKTAAPATTAAPGQKVCVPQVAFTSTLLYGFVQIEGDCSCLLTSETYAVGDYMQILNTGTALVVDGTSGATVMLANSCAISKSAAGTATAQSIVLLNRWAVTAAS